MLLGCLQLHLQTLILWAHGQGNPDSKVSHGNQADGTLRQAVVLSFLWLFVVESQRGGACFLETLFLGEYHSPPSLGSV